MNPRLQPSGPGPRRFRPAVGLGMLLLPLIAMSQVGSDTLRVLETETSLRLTAGGGELAALLTGGTTVTVLEQQGEWLKVSVEGWIPAAALADAGRQPEDTPSTVPGTAAAPVPGEDDPSTGSTTGSAAATDPASTTTATAPPVTGPGVEGQIQLRTGRRRRADTNGLEVMLLPAEFQAEPSETERERLAELDAEAQRLQRKADRAMRQDSFSQAMASRDALMRQRALVLDERTDLLAAVHGRHQAAARRAALATAITDSQGWYSIPSVLAGNYTVYARLVLHKNRVDVEWFGPVTVTDDVVRLDLDESTAGGLLGKPD